MATVVQSQPLQSSGDFWRVQMENHPNFHGWLTSIWTVVSFFLNGHIIVHAARWVIRWCGYVAESALLFAVLWISGTSVAPGIVELFMSKQLMQWFVWLALIVLALIPEVILGNAIINTVSHWQRVASNRRNIVSWVWAALFTVPTILFLGLTAITLNMLTANNGNFVQANSYLLGWRCFAGWTYGLLAVVYAGVGKQMVHAQSTLANVTSITPVHDARVDQLIEDIRALSERVASAQSNATEQVQPEQDELQKSDTPERSEQTHNRTHPNVHKPARRRASRRSEHRPNRTPKSAKRKQPSAYDLVFGVLKEKRSATVAEIVLRTKLAKSTVSPLRTQILKQIEQQQASLAERNTGEIVAIS